jgi:hypothetical protein
MFNCILYNFSFFKKFPAIQFRKDATGFCAPYAKPFLYFFYYTDNFPLATLNKELKYSKQDAENEIKNNGKDLIMEYHHWARLGENARIFAFLPNAFLDGSPAKPSIKLFNTLIFVISLLLLYFSFWKIKKPLVGFFMVSMINCTPFFIVEVYGRQNIFALLGSCFFMVIGLNIFALMSTKANHIKIVILGLITSLIIAFLSEVRNEISIILLSLLLLYWLSNQLNLGWKIIYSILFILTFYGGKQSIRYYFDNKYKITSALVLQQNGHLYTGSRISGHKLWHPVFCGLGDFDTKYGYVWDDRVGYTYATPILQKEYGLNIHYSNKLFLDDYYDKDSLYYVKFDEIDTYEEVVKNKVISDITNDPLWYLTILLKRIARILSFTIPIPFIGWLLFPILYYLIKKRYWLYLKLIVISMPLSATSLLIYSGKGNTYNSVFVYFLILIILAILAKRFLPQQIASKTNLEDF